MSKIDIQKTNDCEHDGDIAWAGLDMSEDGRVTQFGECLKCRTTLVFRSTATVAPDDLEAENTRLKDRVNYLIGANTEMHDEHVLLKEQLAELQEGKKSEISKITRIIRSARSKRKKYRRRKARKAFANFKAMEQKIVDLQEELCKHKRELGECGDYGDDLEEQLAEAQGDLSDFQVQNGLFQKILRVLIDNGESEVLRYIQIGYDELKEAHKRIAELETQN